MTLLITTARRATRPDRGALAATATDGIAFAAGAVQEKPCLKRVESSRSPSTSTAARCHERDGATHTYSAIGLEGRLSLARWLAVKLRVSGNRDFDQNWIEAGLGVNVNF